MKILFILIALLLIAVLIDVPAFGGIMILAIAIWIVYLIVKVVGDKVKPSKAKVKEFKLEIAPGDNSEDYSTYIAGINYRCNAGDIGGFIGTVKPDLNNKYDKNAIAIYRGDGKLLGYIPKDETRHIRRWGVGVAICVGYVKEGDDAPLYGRVKIYSLLDNGAMIEIARYIKWLINNHGVEYAPKELNTSGIGADIDAWHAMLDDIIDQNKSALSDKFSANENKQHITN